MDSKLESLDGFLVNPDLVDSFYSENHIERPMRYSRWWGVVFFRYNENETYNVYRLDAGSETGLSELAFNVDEESAIQVAKKAQNDSMRVCAFCRIPTVAKSWKQINGQCECPICKTKF